MRWAGLEVADPERLTRLVTVAGGDPAAFVPHVSVLRLRSRPGPGADPDPPVTWAAHRGPWWRPGEVLLVASEPGRGGSRYRPVHRVRLVVEQPADERRADHGRSGAPGIPDGRRHIVPGSVECWVRLQSVAAATVFRPRSCG